MWCHIICNINTTGERIQSHICKNECVVTISGAETPKEKPIEQQQQQRIVE